MNFNKQNWKNATFDDICFSIEYGITASAEESGNAILLRITDIDENGKLSNDLKFTNVDEQVFKKYKLKKNDVLIARSGATAGKPYIHKSNKECVFASYLLRFQLNEEKVVPDYVFNFLFSSNYFRQLKRIKIGGAQPNVNTTNLKTLEMPLPSLLEQSKIVEFLQSINNVIDQRTKQERYLRALAKRLIDGLMNEKPTFGNLLEGKELSKVKFADVTNCIEQHKKETLPLGLTRFIGLENIEPENFRISTWGNIADGTTFTKTFASGDVLFGKRRSYLKKVAIADFDGICSGDILVFRAKSDKMLADLLPFYAASEKFIQYAVNTSAGSLSPRTKWRDLAKFEVHLPDLEIQSKILEVLQQIQTTIEQTIVQKQTLKNLKFKLLNEILG